MNPERYHNAKHLGTLALKDFAYSPIFPFSLESIDNILLNCFRETTSYFLVGILVGVLLPGSGKEMTCKTNIRFVRTNTATIRTNSYIIVLWSTSQRTEQSLLIESARKISLLLSRIHVLLKIKHGKLGSLFKKISQHHYFTRNKTLPLRHLLDYLFYHLHLILSFG